MTDLSTLFDHLGWADAEALASIATLPESTAEHAQAVRLYAHLAGAGHIWLARIEGRTPEHPVWPEFGLEAARELAARTLAGLRAVARQAPGELAREIEYRNSAGQPFRNSVVDVLTHVALHGSYHRGQIAMLARRGGGTPAGTDYIAFVRGVPAPPQRMAGSASRSEGRTA